MAELGADTVLVCSNVSPRAIDDDALAAEQLHRLAEPGRRARHADRLRGARLGPPRPRLRPRLADRRGAADHPASASAWTASTSSRAAPTRPAIRDIPGEKIFFLQLADAPAAGHGRPAVEPALPLLPGPGRLRPRRLPAADVLAAGYRGPLSLEVFNDVFRQADPRADRDRRACARCCCWRSRAARPAPVDVSGRRGHAAAAAPALPATRSPSSPWTHWSSRRPSSCCAASASPRRPAPHKPVQLWQQGERARPAQPHRAARRAGRAARAVAAIAVESADPARSAPSGPRRCSRPVLPRDRGPGEADLSAVAAPGRHRRCSSAAPTPRTPTAGSPTSVAAGAARRRRRRAAHRHRPRRAVPAVRLLRRGGAVLPLGARPAARRTAPSSPRPYGLVRSRAARSADGARALRAQRAAARRRRRRAPLQHVAFACRRHLRRRPRDARARRAAAADPRQLLRRPRGAHRARRPRRSSGCASSACSTTATPTAASSCTSTPRCSAGACSSRSSSGAAATTATARRTRRSGWRRSCTRPRWGASTVAEPYPASRPVPPGGPSPSHPGPRSHQERRSGPINSPSTSWPLWAALRS